MRHGSPKHSPSVLLAATLSCAAGSHVQTASALALEEVIVTAQKREQTVADTPIAVTAITSETLNDLGILTLQDLSNFTPSMSYQETAGGGEGNRIYLRGIGRETSSTGTEPGVGIYNNGFYTNEASAASGSVDRIERIEVLRGPQGTLFGRTTTGGAINVIAKKPGDEFEHIARFRAGNYSLLSAELTSSGPITDNIGYLVHYAKADRDSYFENVTGPDPIGSDIDYVEAQIDVDFIDRINWNLRYFSAAFEDETLERAKLSGYRNEPGAPSKLGEIVLNPEAFALLPVAPAERDPFKLSSDFQGSVEVDDQITFQSTLTIDLDGVTIRMLNGYQDYSWAGDKDFDGLSGPASYVESIGQAEESVQHEVQFVSNGDGNIDWVIGLFYYQNDLDQPYTLTDAANPFLINNASDVPNPDGIFYTQRGVVEVTSTAIYGQMDWQATDRLRLSAGLRYSEDEKKGREEQQIFYDSFLDNCGEEFFPEVIATGNPYFTPEGCTRFGIEVSNLEDEHDENWDAVNWRLNAGYDISDNAMVYATVSTGYKPGGFRLGGIQDDETTPENESVVENEEITAYELGYKGSVTETLSLNAALFYYDYTDIQVELSILDQRSGIVTAKLANASSAEIYGFEVETTWAATEKLTLLTNYSYLQSEYLDDFFVSDTKDDVVRNVKGNELNRTPNNKFSLAGYYVQPVADGNLVFTANYTWVDDQFMSVFNDDEAVENYDVVNARISWQPGDGKYEVALFGQNLTDELSFANDFSISALADGNRRTGRPINPRVYGIEAAFFFD